MAQYIDETGKILTIEKVTDPFALQELINVDGLNVLINKQ